MTTPHARCWLKPINETTGKWVPTVDAQVEAKRWADELGVAVVVTYPARFLGAPQLVQPS